MCDGEIASRNQRVSRREERELDRGGEGGRDPGGPYLHKVKQVQRSVSSSQLGIRATGMTRMRCA